MTTKLRNVFYLAVVATLFLVNSSTAGAAPKLSAKEILEKVAKTYASVSTYVDEGAVDTTYYKGETSKETNRDLKPFKTFFDRDKLFKFEYAVQTVFGPKNRYLIFSDFKKTETWWELNEKRTSDQNLQLALVAAAGVSGGSSSSIPKMLLGLSQTCQVSAIDLTDLGGAERVSGQDCFKVTGKRCGGDKVTLWIDSKTFLIRKIEEIWIPDKKTNDDLTKAMKAEMKNPVLLKNVKKEDMDMVKKAFSDASNFDGFWTKTVTTYDPKIGVKIDPKKVVFDPK